MKLVFHNRFSKNTKISNSMKIGPLGAELFHAVRQTDMTKLIAAFHNFANMPNNVKCRCGYFLYKLYNVCIWHKNDSPSHEVHKTCTVMKVWCTLYNYLYYLVGIRMCILQKLLCEQILRRFKVELTQIGVEIKHRFINNVIILYILFWKCLY